jgi:UPF0755 protein
VIIVGINVSYDTYQKVFLPNVFVDKQEEPYFYIHTGASFPDLVKNLYFGGFIKDTSSFKWLAKKKNLASHIHPGRYKLSDRMNNNSLINLLRSGKQEPVDVIFHSIRTKADLAGAVALQIEADSARLFSILNNKQFIDSLGFTKETVMAIFIPNTYEFYWNTDEKEFLKRMKKEFDQFWNDKRMRKAKSLELTLAEVHTLASIIDEETTKNDEKARIAGVYINRLKKGMALQADPTVRFALNDFTIKRILNRHLEVDSPYNTYKNTGLPPGPINLASISAIEAVLNFEKHNYLYFCAKPDFSGYHNFAKTLARHNRNAKMYQAALNKKGIWK